MRGTEEDINLTFNGLFNFCATTSRNPDFQENSRTVATCWSSKELFTWGLAQIRLNHLLQTGQTKGRIGKRGGVWPKACDGATAMVERFAFYQEQFLRFETLSFDFSEPTFPKNTSNE